MKAIICKAGGIGVHITSFGTDWTYCQCGNTRAKWLDPAAGTMVADCRYPMATREDVRFLGMNNQFLLPAITAPGPMWENYQTWHETATSAPRHIFDKSRAGCWAVPARIGSTSDTRWATDDERDEPWNPPVTLPLPLPVVPPPVPGAGLGGAGGEYAAAMAEMMEPRPFSYPVGGGAG